jgi:hypothetical protein
LFDWAGGRRTEYDYYIKLALYQFGSDFPQSIGIRFSKAALNGDVLPFDVTKLAQACQ